MNCSRLKSLHRNHNSVTLSRREEVFNGYPASQQHGYEEKAIISKRERKDEKKHSAGQGIFADRRGVVRRGAVERRLE